MIFSSFIDWFSFFWFLSSWGIYTFYSKQAARNGLVLSSVLFRYRLDWARNMMRRENRMQDIALLGVLTGMVNFLATTSIFAVAGAITVLYSVQDVLTLLEGHSFIVKTTTEQVEFKIVVLILVFVFAFFRLTWAMRQHTFCSLLLGGAPLVAQAEFTPEEEKTAHAIARISDSAGNDFNYGLRAYYFALALLTWFISPWVFIPACTLVVAILYWREFHSRQLKYLISGRPDFKNIK